MAWPKQGTVAVTLNSTTVTGTGTAFAANARVGDGFKGPDGAWYEITNIASDTVLSILPAYAGATGTGKAYAIVPVQGYDKALADAFNALVQQFGTQLGSNSFKALTALVGGTDKLGYFTAADAMASTDFTAKARELLGKASAADMLALLVAGGIALPTNQVAKIGSSYNDLTAASVYVNNGGNIDGGCGQKLGLVMPRDPGSHDTQWD